MELVMQYLHNYFYRFKEKGTFNISFNTITINNEALKGKYVDGQYIRIIGSLANDGVYKVVSCGEEDIPGITVEGCLSDEEFTGYICSLGVPKAFVGLCNEIQTYNEENKAGVMVSESFGGYSYTKATVNGQLATWKDAFAANLKPYRRMTDGLEWVKEVK